MLAYTNLISIIVPAFKRKDIVKETIDSVINQTYSNWELILVDDGSDDGTYEYLDQLQEPDPRIFLYQRYRNPKGAPTCRNIGIEKAKGSYILFLDSDDILAPTCLEERLFFVAKNPDMDFLVFPGLIFHNTPGDTQILWNIDKNNDDFIRFMELDAPWQTSATIWKYDAIMKNGFWDERLSSWQDMDYHTRALLKNLSYKKINVQPDFYYRLDNPEKISNHDKEIKQVYARILLGENIFKYLKERIDAPAIYKLKLNKFFMWICLSFIRKRHFEGIEMVYKTLYKLRITNSLEQIVMVLLMRLNYYFTHNSFSRTPGRLLRSFWYKTLYKHCFENIPPNDCTVKLKKYEGHIVKESSC